MITENEDFKVINGRFPHIGEKIAAQWGSFGLSPYINHLLTDTRNGTRQGFPKEVAIGLFRLLQLHDQQYPHLAMKVTDIWSLNEADYNPRPVDSAQTAIRLW